MCIYIYVVIIIRCIYVYMHIVYHYVYRSLYIYIDMQICISYVHLKLHYFEKTHPGVDMGIPYYVWQFHIMSTSGRLFPYMMHMRIHIYLYTYNRLIFRYVLYIYMCVCMYEGMNELMNGWMTEWMNAILYTNQMIAIIVIYLHMDLCRIAYILINGRSIFNSFVESPEG